MSITWQTPAGSLGVIAEQTFFNLQLLATTPFTPVPAICTATDSSNNTIVCDSTAGAAVGQSLLFFGTAFGNLQQNTVYYVKNIVSATEFTITSDLSSNQTLPLITGTGVMTARFFPTVRYNLQAGTLPQGVQLNQFGLLTGVPRLITVNDGVITVIGADVTNKFTVRAYTLGANNAVATINERTFTLTVTGNDTPEFVTPAGSLGSFYDGDAVNLQIEYTESDLGDPTLIRLVGGELPPGCVVTPTGLITGYIRPMIDVTEVPGYDITSSGTEPYDFISSSFNRNYQFTLEITDGKSNDLRTFEMFVYDRSDLTADDTQITADNTFVTADQTTLRPPFLINAEPSDLGIVRGDNYFAYRFIGQDYDTELLEYAITVNQGFGLPPGLTLDPYTGWYYGFVPDIEFTRLTYSFNIRVRARSLVCTATNAATDIITCDQTTRGDFYLGAAVTFEGESFGGISTGVTYFVAEIVSDTEFKISDNISGIPVHALTTASGRLLCVPQDIIGSQLYPFTLTVAAADFEPVTWLTDPDLGVIENGDISTLNIQATSQEFPNLKYQLVEGSDSSLPQGLTLLSNGLLAGRVSFNTFSIDLGSTTFDASQSTITRLEPTTFDLEFEFTVEAYQDEPSEPLYRVSAVRVLDGGSGYVSAPSLEFSAPQGATAVRATATAVIQGGRITDINVTNPGAGYTSTPTLTVTGGDGSGQQLQIVIQATGNRYLISDTRRFSVRVIRAFNRPLQNLSVVAMPPDEDRALLIDLLNDPDIFVPEYIYRRNDPNFGVSKSVIYQHAFGLAPETLERYVQSLQLNHYWKNLVLGSVQTAQARDTSGQVIYEVVYSNVIDDLVNAQGDSVSKIITLPYAVEMPDSAIVNSVYPNSLINMRDQVIDVVGQISNQLPLWMISKQQDGSVLGFRPAWVICYTVPGRGEQIAYYLQEKFGPRLNVIDFKVDRYVLDDELSRNWDTALQTWRPPVNQTTFDRINTTGFNDLGAVTVCTNLAYADVNARPIEYINALGGLDGITWVQGGGVAPLDTRVFVRDGSTIAFVKQEQFFDYDNSASAFTENIDLFDDAPFDNGTASGASGSFDYGIVIPSGYTTTCTDTLAGDNWVIGNSTLGMTANDKIWFTGNAFGGVNALNSQGSPQIYYVWQVASLSATGTDSVTDTITVADTSDLSVNDQVWFPSATLGGIAGTYVNGLPRPYFVVNIVDSTRFQISNSQGGTVLSLDTASGSMVVRLPRFKISTTPDSVSPLNLDTDTGSMTANYGNNRLAIYEISIADGNTLNLSLQTQTVTDDYIESLQGQFFTTGTLLYRPAEPAPDLSVINWQPLITVAPVITDETIFDGGSVAWVEPVDMYDPTDKYDKYLVFPKVNILE